MQPTRMPREPTLRELVKQYVTCLEELENTTKLTYAKNDTVASQCELLTLGARVDELKENLHMELNSLKGRCVAKGIKRKTSLRQKRIYSHCLVLVM